VRADTLRRIFLSQAAAYEPLAILRIGVATLALVQAGLLFPYRELLLGEHGIVAWPVVSLYVDPWVPTPAALAPLAAAAGVSSAGLVTALFAAHAIGALLLLLGWRTRLAAIATWATYLPLRHGAFFLTYGIGDMMLIALFYCVFMPVGRSWSVDQHRHPHVAIPGEDAAWSVLVLRVHVCVIYLGAGVSKLAGLQWWSGEAVWRALSLPQFQQFDPSPLLAFPVVLQAAALVATFSQLLYAFLVWTRARVPLVLLIESIHVGIAVFLGLWLFSAMMMVLNTAAFGESIWRALRRWPRWQVMPRVAA
jgi:hypothetical protein